MVTFAALNQIILVFSNLDYKKLLENNIQGIAVNLRTETGRIIPFAGGGGIRGGGNTLGRASSSKVVLRPIFHEKANGPIPEALRASFVNFQAN